MAENKDIVGIGEKPVEKDARTDGKPSDALSFFGVPKEEKKEE